MIAGPVPARHLLPVALRGFSFPATQDYRRNAVVVLLWLGGI